MTDRGLRDLLREVFNDLGDVLDGVDDAEVRALTDRILQSQRIFVAGRGRSGLQMRGFAMRLHHLGRTAFVVGETTTPPIAKGDLLIVGSGSGETSTLLPLVERARLVGAGTALLTADLESRLARLADRVVRIPAPASRMDPFQHGAPILPMGSMFECSLALLFEVVVLQLMAATGMSVKEMFARHADLE